MAKTKIEWATHSWNPVTGCKPVSEGCQNCYAQRMTKRLAGRYGYPKDEPFRVTLHRDKFGQPSVWKKPSRIFVCSMGDLFHEDVKFQVIHKIWDIMKSCPQHTFLVLTKRPARMKELLEIIYSKERLDWSKFWNHVWLGVTAENQARADERIPILLQIPAAVRFVSVEPMLGPVDLLSNDYLGGCINCEVCLDNPKTCINRDQNRKINWIICGGETGPGARPMRPAWVRSLRDQCQEAGVPFFFKQWGKWTVAHRQNEVVESSRRLIDGREWNEFPWRWTSYDD